MDSEDSRLIAFIIRNELVRYESLKNKINEICYSEVNESLKKSVDIINKAVKKYVEDGDPTGLDVYLKELDKKRREIPEEKRPIRAKGD